VHKPWKTILRFAVLGLTLAGASYLYAAFDDYTKPMGGLRFTLTTLSVIVCPAQLFFAFCIDCEATGWDGFIMYSIIGALNMTLYALVGCAVVLLRKGETQPPTAAQGN
jgi:hypothetical protein